MAALRGLTARLLAGQALVILAGSASLVLVATAIAPGIFHRHVRDALGSVPHGELAHLDHAFQDTLVVALAIAITVAAVTALAISLLLATRIAAPIRRLADAADRVSHGEQGVRVSLAGADELRTVSASFNTMASALEQAEHNRRAFVSDISHELRTPLATIDGYLEGLTDGVVPSSPDTWIVLRTQTLRMRRLVDDLATLTRAEEGRIDLRRSAACSKTYSATPPRPPASPSPTSRSTSPSKTPPSPSSSTPIPTGSAKCSQTSSKTPPATPQAAAT